MLHRTIRVTNVALLLAASLGGCAAPSVTLMDTRPATVYVEGFRRIAVLDFQGEQGALASQLVQQELQHTGRFVLIPQVALQAAAREPLQDSSGRVKQYIAVEAAQRLQADALLLGTVIRLDSRINGGFKIDSPTAGAQLQYELVEARTGFLRDTNTLRWETFVGREKSAIEPSLAICARQLARRLAPHDEPIEVPLAVWGWRQGLVDERNSWAANGDWEQAKRCWHDALASESKNHAAIYNLGVAAEARGDFASAHALYQQAAEVQSDNRYLVGIERAVRRGEQIQLAQQQRIMHGTAEIVGPERPAALQAVSSGT